MEIWGIVAAGGSGSRMQSAVKKQFLTLSDGIPILIHSLSVLEACNEIQGIVLVCAPEDRETCQALIREAGLTKIRLFADAGATRQQSVYNGLSALPQSCDYAAIHDAARPYLTSADLSNVLADAVQYGASCLAVPVKDTIKIADKNGFIESTPDRSLLWAMQTPQVFRKDWILQAHQQAADAADYACTDDAQVLEKYSSHRVHLCPGSYTNIKITTMSDLF
ncbi:MAG: 2-C-methyl-D-erythritol 4-phosphate cytidylyltransferase [Firmicutes bacterium]|nr:2-C-methyl-D-erythritol 4-phosphate cytidylyltransferase [Bacillota bacterium]